jgi:hypothetical protein
VLGKLDQRPRAELGGCRGSLTKGLGGARTIDLDECATEIELSPHHL